MRYKLGKHSPKFQEKTLRFSALLNDVLTTPPEKVYYEYLIPPSEIGLYGNDEIGDCTCAEVAHHLMLITAHAGKQITPDPKDVIKMYSAISGYDPSTGANDNGAAITDALDYWQTKGLSGHKILGWAQLDHRNLLRRRQGIYLFGGNSVGVQLPAAAESQFEKRENWEIVKHDGGIQGGHCIMESGYGAEGSNFETWGKGDQKASNAWSEKYLDEAYCIICSELLEWIAETRFVNMDTMLKALKEIAA